MAIFNEWVKEITREQYEHSLEYWHRIPDEDKPEIFTEAELYGYGLYSTHTYCEIGLDGKMHYYVRYETGTTYD